MKTTIIKRNSSFFRPYNCNGYEISNIKLYNKTGVLYETGRGWFEAVKKENNYRGGSDITEIELNEVKKANKLNFNRTDNFVLLEKNKYFSKNEYCLYIYADDTNVWLNPIGEFLDFETDTDKHYHTIHSLKLNGLCFYTQTSSRTEKKELGIKIQDIHETLGKNGIKVSSYDVEKILRVYDIVLKGGMK